MAKDEPTPKQQEVLEIIAAAIAQKGYPPTIREIALQLGVHSTNAVAEHLRALERKGMISRESQSSRGIQILCASVSVRLKDALPAALQVGGRFERGIRMAVHSAVADPEDGPSFTKLHVLLDPALFNDGPVEAWRVDEDLPALGLLDGDIAVLAPQASIRQGNQAGLLLNGKVCIRRVYFDASIVRLAVSRLDDESAVLLSHQQFDRVLLGKLRQVIRQVGVA